MSVDHKTCSAFIAHKDGGGDFSCKRPTKGRSHRLLSGAEMRLTLQSTTSWKITSLMLKLSRIRGQYFRPFPPTSVRISGRLRIRSKGVAVAAPTISSREPSGRGVILILNYPTAQFSRDFGRASRETSAGRYINPELPYCPVLESLQAGHYINLNYPTFQFSRAFEQGIILILNYPTVQFSRAFRAGRYINPELPYCPVRESLRQCVILILNYPTAQFSRTFRQSIILILNYPTAQFSRAFTQGIILI
ncbi:hypothetical protein CEXT_430601 [Caerostris extrusa]|uniref:Uncharacterized protein n=1 Tax=Caerostris extrusa TaxID=172846 RepID=A0AAV4V959_CAEEX|nr:hypothetical protein CEXT_430601 [Caerostris extrusa]